MSRSLRPPYAFSTSENTLPHTRLDLLQVAKRKLGFILFFVAMGILFGVFYFLKTPATYRSATKIFVDERNAHGLDGDSSGNKNKNSVEKYLEVLKSSKILAPAVENGQFETLKTFENTEDILVSLRDGNSLSVSPADRKGDSGVISVAFKGSHPEQCQTVLEHVVQSFDEYIQSTTKSLGSETASIISDVRSEYLERLKEVEKEISRLSANPEFLNLDGDTVNPQQIQQSKMYEDLHDVQRERTKLIARLKNIQAARDAGRDPDLLMSDILDEFSDGPLGAYVSTHNQYIELKVREQELINRFGAEHPELVALRNQIKMVNQMRLEELSSMRSGQRHPEADATPGQLIDAFLGKIRNRIQMLDTEEESLLATIAASQKDSAEAVATLETLRSLKRERERLETGYYAVMARLNEVNAAKEHMWRTLTVLDPPSFGQQVAPSLLKSLALGILLGGALGLGLALLKEMAERTFYSAEDVSESIDARVIGHINRFRKSRHQNPDFPKVSPDVLTLHKPAGNEAENYRAIRTALFFKARETDAKVIQITSPSPEDGKSTTVANLAASIAQAGRRVLVIDADFRKPIQRKLFGLTNDTGMTSVICGDATIDEAIEVIRPGFLSVVSSGPLPTNPSELLISMKFNAIIDELRNDYDFILVDTPPLTAVTDPTIVAQSVDLVYLVLRIRNGVRTSALRSKEIIDSLNVDLGGVIINALAPSQQKNYQYSARYAYGHNDTGNRWMSSRNRSGGQPQFMKPLEIGTDESSNPNPIEH